MQTQHRTLLFQARRSGGQSQAASGCQTSTTRMSRATSSGPPPSIVIPPDAVDVLRSSPSCPELSRRGASSRRRLRLRACFRVGASSGLLGWRVRSTS